MLQPGWAGGAQGCAAVTGQGTPPCGLRGATVAQGTRACITRHTMQACGGQVKGARLTRRSFDPRGGLRLRGQVSPPSGGDDEG